MFGAHLLPLEVAMEQTIHNLYVQTIRAELELSRIVGASLRRELDDSNLTIREKANIVRFWSTVLGDGDMLSLLLEFTRRTATNPAECQS